MNLRNAALAIFQAALQAAESRQAVLRTLRREGDRLWVAGREYNLDAGRVWVIGFGKASAAMAQAVEEVLGDRIAGGWVTSKYGHTLPLQKTHLHEAGHPLPDENSLIGARQILDLLRRAGPDDLVLCLISGGGSALLELPAEGISLQDLRAATDVLLRSGATIDEMNALRKHLSQVKGGRLARRLGGPGPHIVSLILSDVLGSPLDAIASGPTAPDPTTFAGVVELIDRRHLRGRLPESIVSHLERGARGEIPETLKVGDPALNRVQNVVVADNGVACDAAVREAQAQGFHALLLSTFVQGEAREVAQVLAAIAKEIIRSNRPAERPACIIAGGETTVTVRGSGLGGRNQELALAAALQIAERTAPEVVVLSAGTDGTDGPTDAAGALADGATLARAAALGLDARASLANNDAYHFFQPLGDLIITGPTHTNVNDIMLLLVGA